MNVPSDIVIRDAEAFDLRPLSVVLAYAAVDGRDVGAAWARRLTSDDPGYGWVSDDIPELTIGVNPDVRGQGIGHALLDALVLRVRAVAPALSLSVEDGNTSARALYEKAGFVVVGRIGNSDTMLLEF